MALSSLKIDNARKSGSITRFQKKADKESVVHENLSLDIIIRFKFIYKVYLKKIFMKELRIVKEKRKSIIY